MIRPDLAIRPTAPTAATTPLAAAGGGRGFGALYGDVRGEVEDFIANGSGPSMPAAPMLTLEGQRVRDAVTAAASPSFSGDQAAFVAGVTPAAEEAARQLGVAPELVVAHAALESGWGRKPLLQADGSTTHNVFGIKATGGWTGDVAAARTTEVEDGVAVPRTERFRSYPDATAAFRDYAQVLLDNPRYRGALNTGSDARAFAEGLARGGYATDPAYADKLTGVARSVMASDERLQVGRLHRALVDDPRADHLPVAAVAHPHDGAARAAFLGLAGHGDRDAVALRDDPHAVAPLDQHRRRQPGRPQDVAAAQGAPARLPHGRGRVGDRVGQRRDVAPFGGHVGVRKRLARRHRRGRDGDLGRHGGLQRERLLPALGVGTARRQAQPARLPRVDGLDGERLAARQQRRARPLQHHFELRLEPALAVGPGVEHLARRVEQLRLHAARLGGRHLQHDGAERGAD